MKRKIIGFLVCTLLITTILPITVSSDYPSNNIIYVDDDNIDGPWDGSQEHPYRLIADGIDATVDGDTVYVYSGTYFENFSIRKSICLEGENKETTIIDGGNLKQVDVIDIICSNVTVKRFSIINGDDGIDVYSKVDNITISENIIKYNIGQGLVFFNSNRNTITHNIIRKNGDISEPFSGGILFINSSNNNISGNIVSGNFNFGISIFLLYNSIVSGNSITYNLGTGLELQHSYDTVIVRNNFIKNGQKTSAFLLGDLADNAMFHYSMFPERPYNNSWDKNFWNRGRILPKPIFGMYSSATRLPIFLPWITFDWHPTLKPYDIQVPEGTFF
ncbi:MAG: right-handed parallel beta-helix repeat-containing protein [Candidatus Thermoplasmatota archaeon]|nr:right-handed parallel beta-helix repeat-containing protein [Candidatus Thermoplasmatota archaeon]